MEMGYKYFASVYGCGTYSNGGFDSGTACAVTSQPAADGVLQPTGTDILFGLAGGFLLVVLAVALFIGARRKSRR